ncbi:MAG: hypothetical protein Q9195_007000 [Heterodermia aff. obscurata]
MPYPLEAPDIIHQFAPDCNITDPARKALIYNAVESAYQHGRNRRILPQIVQSVIRKEPHYSPDHELDFDRWHITAEFFDYGNMVHTAHIYVSRQTTGYEGERFFEPRAPGAKTALVPMPDLSALGYVVQDVGVGGGGDSNSDEGDGAAWAGGDDDFDGGADWGAVRWVLDSGIME